MAEAVKYCSSCERSLPLMEFGNNSRAKGGLEWTCKECCGRVRRKWKRNNPGMKAKWDAEHKDSCRKSRRKWEHANRVKTRVYKRVKYAIENGKLVRPDECSDCGCAESNIVAHHEDYSKPFDIVWLCVRCHGKRHRRDPIQPQPAALEEA